MQITLKTLTGMSIDLNVEFSDTVLSVKQKIQEKEGFPDNLIHIIFNRKQLQDDKTLAECNVRDGSVLNFWVSMRGR